MHLEILIILLLMDFTCIIFLGVNRPLINVNKYIQINLWLTYITLLFSVHFPTHDFQAFENEWIEVEVKQPIEYPKNTAFLMDSLSTSDPLNHNLKRDGLLFLEKLLL